SPGHCRTRPCPPILPACLPRRLGLEAPPSSTGCRRIRLPSGARIRQRGARRTSPWSGDSRGAAGSLRDFPALAIAVRSVRSWLPPFHYRTADATRRLLHLTKIGVKG